MRRLKKSTLRLDPAEVEVLKAAYSDRGSDTTATPPRHRTKDRCETVSHDCGTGELVAPPPDLSIESEKCDGHQH